MGEWSFNPITGKLDRSGSGGGGGGDGVAAAFVSAYLNTPISNLTGDGTNAVIIFDTVTADATTSYNATTGVFTAPISGNYQISSAVTYFNVNSTFTLGNLQILTSGSISTQRTVTCNPGKLYNVNGAYSQIITANIGIVAGTTLAIKSLISGGTKTVGISGQGGGSIFTGLNIIFIRA